VNVGFALVALVKVGWLPGGCSTMRQVYVMVELFGSRLAVPSSVMVPFGAALRSGPAFATGATLPLTAVMLTASGWLSIPLARTTKLPVYVPATSGVKVVFTELGLVSEALLPAGFAVKVHWYERGAPEGDSLPVPSKVAGVPTGTV
jgi:hypothetical protein